MLLKLTPITVPLRHALSGNLFDARTDLALISAYKASVDAAVANNPRDLHVIMLSNYMSAATDQEQKLSRSSEWFFNILSRYNAYRRLNFIHRHTAVVYYKNEEMCLMKNHLQQAEFYRIKAQKSINDAYSIVLATSVLDRGMYHEIKQYRRLRRVQIISSFDSYGFFGRAGKEVYFHLRDMAEMPESKYDRTHIEVWP
ncbi:MAG: hypothetical protein PGN34_15085 [Methylobacterium frigidaeris]